MAEETKSATATAKPRKSAPVVASSSKAEEDDVHTVEEEEGGWKEFIWNRDKKEFLGRKGKSWWDIFVFYVMFFIGLILFFMLSWYISLLFVENYVPYKNGEGSLLYEKGPGLTFRPTPDRDSNGVSTMIWFSPGAIRTGHSFWSGQLKNWTESMPKDTKQCSAGDNSIKEPCQVKQEDYGECDGIGDDTFGYAVGEPCILLKLNRVRIP